MTSRNAYRWSFWLVLATGLLAGADSAAQHPGSVMLNPEKAITQYVYETWRIDDGLPQNLVDAVAQTRDGYLWLGSEEGLTRFDGNRFTVFDKQNVDAFSVSNIYRLLTDSRGTLWIGTQGGGLVAYRGGVFTAFTAEDGLPADDITALAEDRDGTLWIGTYGAGLVRYRDGAFTSYGRDAGFAGDLIQVVHEDRKGTLWVGTDVGLFRFEDGRFVPGADARLTQAFITTLHETRDGLLWVGTERGQLYRLRDGRITGAEGFRQTVTSLLQDRAGSLWIGSYDGLHRYRDGTLEHFSRAEGLLHDRVTDLYEDREGSLWIGTAGGLSRLRDSKFTTYMTSEGLSSNDVYSVFEGQDGTLWVGTQNGISRLRDGRFTHITRREGLSGNEVTTLYGDPSGTVWAGTYGDGLNRLQDGTVTRYTKRHGLPSDNIFALYADARDRLWIGTDAGVSRFENGAFTNLGVQDGLTSNFVTALLQGRDGALWVGTYDGGLNRLKDGKITAFTTRDGLSSNEVLALYEDAQGTLWIGTNGGGLNRLKDGKITAFTTRDGLFNDRVFVILEDEQGNLWMTCNKGIFRVEKRNLEAFAQGRAEAVRSVAYGKADGLKSIEAHGGQQPAGWRSRDGHLWFATSSGVARIDPAHIPVNPLAPTVVIERLLVDHQRFPLAGTIALPAGSRNISFDYTGLSLVAPEKMQFRYRLAGEEEWVEAGARRTAFYSNLRPGTHTFQVIASNNDGIWNETGATLTFELEPYFYQTSWFFLLCLLGLGLAVYGGYQLRLNQVRTHERELQQLVAERTHDLRLEKEKTEDAKAVIEAQANKLRDLDRFKTRFFANISHEFRTPLTMIIGPLENALHGTYGRLDAPVQRQLNIMLRNALRLMRLINQLLDLSKLEAGKMHLRARPRNIVEFLEGVLLTCTAFAEQKQITMTFESEEPYLELYFEPDKLEKVFFNLLSNALKHTPQSGTITVSVRALDGAVRISVRDTGRGIPAEHLDRIFDRFHQVDGSNTREHEGTGIGLALARELVLLHHGTIEVQSEPGRGTEFILVMPTGNAHLKQEELAPELDAEQELEPEHGALAELASAALDLSRNAPLAAEPGPRRDDEDSPLILVVDDNRDVREYVGSILGEQYQVTYAEDGHDALEKARALQPSLIISDVMMPRMDGNMLCLQLKSDPSLSHIPVILLTARATEQSKLEGLQIGADDYLSKPFNARELLARTENLLLLRRREKELYQLNEQLAEKVQAQVDLILRERAAYEEQLIASKERAEASDRLKTSILNNLNHEFRTPVSAILGYAQILASESPDGLQEFTQEIDLNGRRLMKTLDALIELSRLEADRIGARLEVVDPVQILHEAAERLLPYARRRSLTLRVEEVPAVPLRAELDAGALDFILGHLLDNAIKFTDEGEVTLAVQERLGRIEISVRDTGRGIEEAFLPYLFDAFTQESTGLTRSHEGSGLGLAICKRLSERMGGTIAVDTAPGKGSTFTLSFPSLSASGDGLSQEPFMEHNA